jgi:SgrR family transcriptional regulator
MTNGIGEIVSDIWLNSANFTLPLDFSLFSHLYEVPLIQHCIDRDWQQDAAVARGRDESGPGASSCWPAGDRAADPPLADDPGAAQYARLRMNTLGWFDFKSAWFAPPEP